MHRASAKRGKHAPVPSAGKYAPVPSAGKRAPVNPAVRIPSAGKSASLAKCGKAQSGAGRFPVLTGSFNRKAPSPALCFPTLCSLKPV